MGRQPKQGLDYWLRDIGLFRDPKLRRPRQEYGYLAPYVYECLLDILYGDKGYYIDCRGDAWENLLWQLSEFTQGKYAPTTETLASVVDSLAACELFSDDLYRRGFITSKRVQKNFFSATVGRTSPRINFDIWLLSEADMRELNPSGKSIVLQSFISWRETRVSQQETPIFKPESTQRREEERREEESIEEQSIEEQSIAEESRDRSATDLTDLTMEIEKLIGGTIDVGFCAEIKRLLSAGMDKAVFIEASMRTSNKNPADPPPYLRRVLQGFEREGIWKESDLIRQTAPRNATSFKEPTGPLEQWELDWLAEIKAKMKADAKKESRQ